MHIIIKIFLFPTLIILVSIHFLSLLASSQVTATRRYGTRKANADRTTTSSNQHQTTISPITTSNSNSNSNSNRQQSQSQRNIDNDENYKSGKHGTLRPSIDLTQPITTYSPIDDGTGSTSTSNNNENTQSTMKDTRNVNKLFIAFEQECVNTEIEIQSYINDLITLYPCLSQDNTRGKNIYHTSSKDDWHTYLLIQTNNDNDDGSNTNCIDEIEIDYDDYCILYIDYELIYEQSKGIINNLDCTSETVDTQRWHLDFVDGIINDEYKYIDTQVDDLLVDIYILDTGVLSTHYEFNDTTVIHLGNSANETYTDNDIIDGHGTHVAGIAVGKTVGIARGINIYEYAVCRGSNGGCASQDIEDGYDAVLRRLQNNPSRKGIINLSYGTTVEPAGFYQNYIDWKFEQFISNGGYPIAAAGNSGNGDCIAWPATSDYCISVGSYTEDLTVTEFSNYGECVDIYAPGDYVYSSWYGDDTQYAISSGTSQATPVISGLVAQMLSINGLLTFKQVLDVLQTSSNNIVLSSCPSTNICYGIIYDCESIMNQIMIPTNQPTHFPTLFPSNEPSLSPTNNPTPPTLSPTNPPTDPYIYCCNERYDDYSSTCNVISDRSECLIKRRFCYWDSNDCRNFICGIRGETCITNNDCCSEDCADQRGSFICL